MFIIINRIRVWNTIRTATQIATWYRYGISGTDLLLLSLYHRWDQGITVTIMDDTDQQIASESECSLNELYMGSLPGIAPFMTWADTTRIPEVATHPFMVASRAPIVGAGPLVMPRM
jgi:hypothetical protein